MEVVRCHPVAVIDSLHNFGSTRTGTSSSLISPPGKAEKLENDSRFLASGGIGSFTREGRDHGDSRKSWCCFGERRVGVSLVIRGRGDEQLDDGKEEQVLKVCVRCGTAYRDEDNSPVACKFHGHMTGDRGLYALAPPHQGIDGEWTDSSGVIVYKWNDEDERPSTGSKNWKSRWTCCGEYAEDATPCRSGSHVSYDDGATRF